MSASLPCAAVLFDCDGVLVDSRALSEHAWRVWAGEYGQDPDEVLRGTHGRRSVETVRRFLPDDAVPAGRRRIDELEVALSGDTTALPGAAALLDAVGDRAAVVTSGSRDILAARLAGAGLVAPRVVISADDVEHGKPDPSGYLLAAAALGVAASACAVVEDSANGIAAARAAGVAWVVGVGDEAADADPDVLVDDLAALTWTGDGLRVSR